MFLEQSNNQTSKFVLGQIVATRNAVSQLTRSDTFRALARHRIGDWGELCTEDRDANERALLHGGRLFSKYKSEKDIVFWIITEADRSVTTILLPEDY
jgi:hypothetical protein